MLRRNSSRSSRRQLLSRSKSTSSIYHNPVKDLQLFDPVIAERDAQIAARLSYERAHGRTMAYPQGNVSGSSSPKFLRDGSRHNMRSEGSSSRQGHLQVEETHGLKRQKSIRFAGPGARPRRNLASRATDQQFSLSHSVSKLSMTDTTVLHPRAHSSFSRNRDSSFTLASESPLHSLATKHGGLAADDDAGPLSYSQSYRQVRKSRSMFTSSDQFDSMFRDGGANEPQVQAPPPRSRYAALNKENEPTPTPISNTPSLRAPKSTSFLRSRRDQSSSKSDNRPDSNLAVQLARGKFKEQAEGDQSRLKSQPSYFFRSKARRTESSLGLRKSLRYSSNNSAALSSAFSGDSLNVPKGGSLRKTARKVSSTIKTKFKGIFGRKTSENSTLARDFDDESSFNIPIPSASEEPSISRGPSRIASLQAMQPCQQIKSCEGSIESCDEEEKQSVDERSRVTSWTDSVTNTVASQSACSEWERQRLSVIKENGMHFSSPAINRTAVNRGVMVGMSAPVDSQQVYTALMQRANEIQQREDQARTQSIEEIRSHGIAPPRSSSVDQIETFPASPPTIRCVDSNDRDVFKDKNSTPREGLPHSTSRSNSSDCDQRDRDTPADYYKRPESPPRPVFAAEDAPSEWQSSNDMEHHQKWADYERSRIVNRSSAFFSSPANHFFRAQSPFRRALQENMKAVLNPQCGNTIGETGYLGSLSDISLPSRHTSIAGSDTVGKQGDDESVYSTNEDGEEYPRGRDSGYLVDRFPKPPLSHSSTGMTNQLGKSTSGYHLGQRAPSAASSVE